MADQKFKLSFNGKLIEDTRFEEEEINKYFRISESYNLSADRSDSLKHNVNFTKKEIVQIKTSDGLEWIGYADDIPEIYGDESSTSRADGVESYHMITDIKQRGSSDRAGGDSIKNALLNVILKNGPKISAIEVAEIVDNKQCPNPGLHKLDSNGKATPVEGMPSDKLCLLFIHGTISSYESGFSNIDPHLWNSLYKLYNGEVYAYNHKTLSVSPIENGFDLLNILPNSISLDIVSHSRGGLVADTLARCDFRNEIKGFTEDDIKLIEIEFEEDDEDVPLQEGSKVAKVMRDMNAMALIKNIKVNKIVRVACPAAGTTLLSKRLDHFLNAILSLLGLAVGSKLNPVYQYFKLFLLKVVEERSNPQAFPGLWSMVPDSTFQIINNRNVKLSSHLVSITGDSKVGNGLLHSLKVILTNLYFWKENDFIVNTASMTKGLVNRRTNVFYKIQNKQIDHFSYFKIEGHMKIVFSALNNQSIENVSWTNIQRSYTNRGIVLDLADMGVLSPRQESGTKPIVVLLPGIMGSNIYYRNDRKWLDFREINKGALGDSLDKIHYDQTEAKSIIAKYYKDFHDYLIENNYDVVVFPFDWRKSLSESVEDFDNKMKHVLGHDQPVRIVAHSMGGLLVRQWKIDKRKTWEQFREATGSKFVMLGTPWKGSHLLLEVFTGDSRRVKQLHLLDFKHNKRQLLDSLVGHRGLYDLLPISDNRLDEAKTWKEVYQAAGKRNMSPIPKEQLDYYKNFKSEVSDHLILDSEDKNIIYYIAGKNKKTVNDYEIKSSFFRGKYVSFKHTSEGDGSVTWATGIPEGLRADHLYYVDVEHGNLACDKDTFLGLLEILNNGKTTQSTFSKGKLRSGDLKIDRGGLPLVGIESQNEKHLLDSDPLDNIFGISNYDIVASTKQVILDVEVFNGDLKWSKYPLMVGHFKDDGIVSAESALDGYLDNKLSERHMMGFYPRNIGDQEIIYDNKNSPIGAIIIGLGDKDELTGFNLSKSVEKAMLKYAVFFRDNRMNMEHNEAASTSISTLLIGSNYGKLPMKESIRSILLGIQNANEIINQFESLKRINKVEFVDYYEDNAYECYKILQELQVEKNTVKINLKDDITVGYRNKRRLLRDESRSWWQSFSTELKLDVDCDGKTTEYLDFGTYNRQASASKEAIYVDMDLAKYIADELSTVQEWDPVNSKVIFEMLLPNRYKDFIRNHRNIEWRFNEAAASFPWEMFHDFAFGDKPTFIESGLIRQLYSTDSNIRPAIVRKNNALIIANPKFKKEGGLPPLPGAKVEGEAVVKLLKEKKFEVIDKIEKGPLEIVKSLFSGEFKVLHIASHGLYNYEAGKVGIAIGDGQLLTPGTINQISAIPEFVFINCCFSGTIVPENEAYSKGRNMLAANIGTQLIKMGVKAVVVAGWAVHDGAAHEFAASLYKRLLKGTFFGDAVTKARHDCYSKFPDYNTWGAYQCYGDQFYRLVLEHDASGEKDNLILEKEIEMALDNVLSSAKSLEISVGDHSNIDRISTQMQTLVERAESLGKYTSEIIEREAQILTYLGRYAQAVLKYRELFEQDEGTYNVECLDIYCNIRAKNLVTCTECKCKKTNDETGAILSDLKCGKTNDTIKDILADMNSYELVGNGSRRLSTIGSTYKRVAMLVKDRREIRDYLEIAANKYREAAEILGIENRASIYQFTSFITISSFCNSGLLRKNKKFNINLTLKQKKEEYLENWIEIVDHDDSDRTNIYDQLAKIQLRMSALILGGINEKSRKDLTTEIIELYAIQISRSINLKDLIGEIEWIEFQILMCNEFHEKFKDCIPHFEKIRAFLLDFYRRPDQIEL